MENTKALLRDVEYLLQSRPGEDFNIFSVLGRERREESTHCRLLYELLRPNGSHVQKDAFLAAFFKTVLDREDRFTTGEKIGVYREYAFDDGRIDLLLMGKDFCYPIEVKIDAADQDRQLERYARFARAKKAARAAEAGKDFDFQVYYLTLDGHAPSPKSLGQVSMAHISCISFGQDILRWLNSCSWSTKNTPDLDSILRQYSRLLKKLTGYGGGDVYMDRITELVGSCRENYESAVAVAGVLARVREKKIQTVFDKIQDSFAKCGLQSEELRDKNREFSRFCAIRANEKYRVELWFQASVYEGYALVYGVVLRKIVDGKPQVVSSSCELAEFEEVFACPGWRAKVREQVDDFAAWQKKGCWWIWERNILGEGDPLYLDPTDLDADLFDPGYFADVLARIQKELDEQLPHILDTGVWA